MIEPSPLLEQAARCFQTGDLKAAETTLGAPELVNDPNALHLLGLVFAQSNRPAQALGCLRRAAGMIPDHALLQWNLGKLFAATGQDEAAILALAEALRLDPGLDPARLDLGHALFRLERPAQAIPHFETALARNNDPKARAGHLETLAQMQRATGLQQEALESLEKAQALAPGLAHLEMARIGQLQALHRNDEALAALAAIVAREPQNLAAQHAYNSLLYRLGREEEFLVSFDAAGDAPQILRAKAVILMQTGRAAEAVCIFRDLAARDPADADACSGLGAALAMQEHYEEAQTATATALALSPDSPAILCRMADLMIRMGDPAQGADLAARAHALTPNHQVPLSLMGAAWRALDDHRDDALNGYDGTLVRSFDLEPPKGWRDMESFHAELVASLDAAHPRTREYFDQTLRGGTQTQGRLFGSGLRLVELLRERLIDAVARYIAQLPDDRRHPMTGRRGGGFSFTDSWSSRLKDQGFHTNHIHPKGWISSCYYVAVPDAVRDADSKQGWITFGQSLLREDLPERHAIQPKPGRLVLFPSYTWHGTIPFRSQSPRTTIAFDVVPR